MAASKRIPSSSPTKKALVAPNRFAPLVKAGIVAVDERESGLRELLNFGHTLGHAYEAASRYRVTHGEAMSVGMVFAAALADVLDLAPTSLRERLEALLGAAGLPTRATLPARTWTFLARDKKARAGAVRSVAELLDEPAFNHRPKWRAGVGRVAGDDSWRSTRRPSARRQLVARPAARG